MQRYLVERPEDVGDSGIYLRDSHYFIYVTIRNTLAPHAKSNPSDVRLTITNPCGINVVDNQAMTNESTGEYSYDYDIPDDAQLGKYDVKVSTLTHKSLTQYDMYVLPFNAIPEVRRLSGIEQWKSVSDEDLAMIIWNAFEEVRDEVFNKHFDVAPKVDPDTGNWFDGTTTEFRTKHKYLADYDLDGEISQASDSCGIDLDGDIDGYWLDEDYERQDLTVTVDDATIGKINITQSDGVTAIPRDNCGVFLTYWTEYHTYNDMKFKEAVEYLAAHNVAQRFHETDRATLVDLETNKTIFITDPNRLEKLYKKALACIREPMCDGVR